MAPVELYSVSASFHFLCFYISHLALETHVWVDTNDAVFLPKLEVLIKFLRGKGEIGKPVLRFNENKNFFFEPNEAMVIGIEENAECRACVGGKCISHSKREKL